MFVVCSDCKGVGDVPKLIRVFTGCSCCDSKGVLVAADGVEKACPDCAGNGQRLRFHSVAKQCGRCHGHKVVKDHELRLGRSSGNGQEYRDLMTKTAEQERLLEEQRAKEKANAYRFLADGSPRPHVEPFCPFVLGDRVARIRHVPRDGSPCPEDKVGKVTAVNLLSDHFSVTFQLPNGWLDCATELGLQAVAPVAEKHQASNTGLQSLFVNTINTEVKVKVIAALAQITSALNDVFPGVVGSPQADDVDGIVAAIQSLRKVSVSRLDELLAILAAAKWNTATELHELLNDIATAAARDPHCDHDVIYPLLKSYGWKP